MPRKLRPRPAIVVRPSFVSDATCFAVLGIVPRKFREQLVPLCEHVTRLGQTVAVPLDEAEQSMRKLAATPDSDDEQTSDARDEDEPTSVADVMRRAGRELA
jgi:hypothetical protein